MQFWGAAPERGAVSSHEIAKTAKIMKNTKVVWHFVACREFYAIVQRVNHVF
jgi:hypothetical protein